jgi:UDP-N-acetylmuramoyl-tripeptide--D-alanyl-D-alanine ligase
LTLSRLWQIKEWRWDRLLEELRREGLTPLFGKLRPVILMIFILGWILQPHTLPWLILGTLGLFSLLTITQFGVRRQKMPVWTQKARVLTAAAFILTAIVAILCVVFPAWILLPLLPVLQPFFLAVAWVLFLPVDRYLKKRIMDQARAIRMRNPDLMVIGITGSVGKTTTKELLGHVLADLHPLVTPAHVNTEMGVAQWLIRELPRYAATQTGKKILIVEMGAYRKGEIALMSTYVRQTIGVLTHVGTQHLALFGSQEALRDAKAEIVTTLPADGHAFLNGDNDLCRTVRPMSPSPVTLVGTDGKTDLRATNIAETPKGIAFTVDGTRYDLSLHGTHNITNVLLAIAVAKHLGMDAHAIREQLKTFTPPQKTFSVREERGVRILDDTHNASAASMRAAIAWARSQPYDTKILLTAGLIELGEAQERTEREMGSLAADVFQRVIFTQPKAAGAFPAGYGKSIESPKVATRVAPDSLLVCVGRMPASAIERLLPKP